MQNDNQRSYRKLNPRNKTILQLVLIAYLLVSMGLFSWVPLFLFQHDHAHRVTLQSSGQMVSWTMHHIGEKPHDDTIGPHALSQSSVHDVSSHAADHVLATPSDDFVQHILKTVEQAEKLIIVLSFLLLPAFFVFFKYLTPRHTGIVPVFNFPIRNSISILTRTVVLRH